MTSKSYRSVPIGETSADAVTVGIEQGAAGPKAAVWWQSKGDVDADEAEFGSVPEALEAAEAARALHGFSEVVVVIADPTLWDRQWGELRTDREPIGQVAATDLTSDETETLAFGIEAERDA